MTKPDEKEFKKTMDARDWKEGLNTVLVNHGEQPVDPELLIGWFANAIMFGYDEAVKQNTVTNTQTQTLSTEIIELKKDKRDLMAGLEGKVRLPEKEKYPFMSDPNENLNAAEIRGGNRMIDQIKELNKGNVAKPRLTVESVKKIILNSAIYVSCDFDGDLTAEDRVQILNDLAAAIIAEGEK